MQGKKSQYRITFDRAAVAKVDPIEFSWLLSKHDMDVVAVNKVPMLFVQCSEFDVTTFVIDVNREFGTGIFKRIDVAVYGKGYEDTYLVEDYASTYSY